MKKVKKSQAVPPSPCKVLVLPKGNTEPILGRTLGSVLVPKQTKRISLVIGIWMKESTRIISVFSTARYEQELIEFIGKFFAPAYPPQKTASGWRIRFSWKISRSGWREAYQKIKSDPFWGVGEVSSFRRFLG